MLRLALSFVGLVSGFALLSATADELIDRTGALTTWNELCAVVDCGQFPKGYSTIYINGEYYYFPLRQSLRVVPDIWVPASFDPMFGRFIERDQNDRVTRTFGYSTGSFSIAYCCNWLLKQTELADEWPKFEERSEEFPMESARVSLDVWDSEYFATRLERYVSPESQEGPALPSYESLDSSSWTSLGESFWLIKYEEEISQPNNYPHRYLVLLSKIPMLFGRHVLVVCGGSKSCDIYTVPFPTDENRQPNVKIWGFSIREYEARACEAANPVLACDIGLEVFDKLGAALPVLETMFERLKVKPADVEID